MRSYVGRILVVIAMSILSACSREPSGDSVAPQGQWISLFNGKDLDGWVVKIRGRALGDDPMRTFRVVDGALRVDYSDYRDFGTSNGMLIYNRPLARYWLRAEYRFIGEQPAGAPAWAFRDSGIQLHGQTPDSLELNQEFPVGLEINLIGGKLLGRARPTGNVCTSGVTIELAGSRMKEKCSSTSDATIRLPDQWVRIEARIDDADIEHWVNGRSAVKYANPVLDPADPLATVLLSNGQNSSLKSGYLSVQSNGAPIEFRKIEILPISAL